MKRRPDIKSAGKAHLKQGQLDPRPDPEVSLNQLQCWQPTSPRDVESWRLGSRGMWT